MRSLASPTRSSDADGDAPAALVAKTKHAKAATTEKNLLVSINP